MHLPINLLRQLLTPFSKVVPRNPSLPILRCIRIDQWNGHTTITATTLDFALTWSEQTEPEPITQLAKTLATARWQRTNGSCLVTFTTLRDAVRAADPGSTLTIERTGKATILRYKMAGSPAEVQDDGTAPLHEFPDQPQRIAYTARPFARFDSAARTQLLHAFTHTSGDDTRYTLLGVLIGQDMLVATDGRRLFRHCLPARTVDPLFFPEKESLILPTTVQPVLSTPALLSRDWEITFQNDHTENVPVSDIRRDEWKQACAEAEAKGEPKPTRPRALKVHRQRLLEIESGPWRLTVRPIDGVFPNYNLVIPTWTASRTVRFADPKRLIDILRKLPVTEKDTAVRFHLEAGTLTVSYQRTTIPVPGATIYGTSAPLTVAFNRDFTVQALATGMTEFHLLDASNPAVFAGGTSIVVLMPMRMAEEKQKAKPEAVAPVESVPAIAA